MQEISGVLHELGEGVTQTENDMSVTTYSYIKVGDNYAKRLKVTGGLNAKVRDAVKERVTLFVQDKLVVGLKLDDGKIFGSYFGNRITQYLYVFLLALLGVMLSIVIIGLPFLWHAWKVWRLVSAQQTVARMPNVVLI